MADFRHDDASAPGLGERAPEPASSSVEEALRRSEHRYRMLVENIPGSVVVLFDRDLRILLVDGPEVAATGYSKAGMEGRRPSECLPPEFAVIVERNFRAVLSGERFGMELPFGDRHYHYEYVPLRDGRGQIEFGLVVGQNVTERHRAEQALRASELRFRTLFEAAPDAFVIHDLEANLLDGNRAAEELFGLDRREVAGQNLFSAGHFAPESIPTLLAAREKVLAGLGAGPDQVRFRRNDGRTVDLELRTVPIRLPRETVVLAIARDVSARLAAEESRRVLEEQLHHAMKMDAIGRLAGGIAHDFNNLLSAILANVELVHEELGPNDPRRVELGEAIAASRRAAKLVSQLLVFSRKQAIRPIVVDLNEVLRRMIRMLGRLLGETVRVAQEPSAGPLPVCIDPGQLEQILVNLSINARDAMPQGGDLRFSAARVRVDAVGPSDGPGAVPGDYVLLRVSDSGCGMTDETQARIFEPFFTTKDPGVGTGLGLSILYGIVRQNRGFIRVSSAVGAGTTFEIFLPVVEAAPEAGDHEPSAHRLAAGRGVVLLVEDDEAVLRVAERCLRRQGYEVHGTTQPLEALRIAQDTTRPLDVLVTDIVMPAMNGPALYAEVTAVRPALPVVFVSGYADPALFEQVNRQPGAHFLEKPFTLDELLAAVRDAL
jgi:PAS domain S-box-containing protein